MIVSESEGVMSTKEKILDAALTLFAENGYDGTSVEQIANIVGIKAPSLYKHYKGKEDILNALIDSAEARYEERMTIFWAAAFALTSCSLAGNLRGWVQNMEEPVWN